MSTEIKSLGLGSIAFVLFVMMRKTMPLHNMEFFVIACLIFAIVTLLAYFLLPKIPGASKPSIEKGWSILLVALIGIWMILFYVNETNTEQSLDASELIRRYFPFPLWIILMFTGTLACLFLLRKNPSEKSYGLKSYGIRRKIRFLVALMFTIGTSVQFYAPNIFQDIQGGTYHSHAYTNSIINACWLIPYSKNMESLYGHYGILYMPVLKLMHKFFHIDYLTGIFIIAAVLAGVSILLFLYILNYFAQNDLIFYLGMFAIGEEYFMLMQGGVYLQVHPHRMIFPILLAALVLHEYKTEKKHNIAAICILALSSVWSTEVGIVTMLSFALYRWIQCGMDGKAFSSTKILLLIRELLLYVFLPFILAYMIISGYNLLCGGSILDFKEFMFPLISDRDYIDKIELPLPDATHAWIGTAILFFCAVTPALLHLFFPLHKGKRIDYFYFFIGVMGLGLMLYYINRPVEGSLFIILFPMLILQAIILQKSQEIYQEWRMQKDSLFKRPDHFLFLSLRIITTLILFIMAFDCIYSMPKAWKTSSETIWKRDELMEFAEYVWVQIPPDAVSFGEGVPELMALIDRDTHLHSTEWSYLNMPLDTMEWVRNELENQKWIFCSSISLWYMQTYYPGLTDHFELHEIFEYNGAEFHFYVANSDAG